MTLLTRVHSLEVQKSSDRHKSILFNILWEILCRQRQTTARHLRPTDTSHSHKMLFSPHLPQNFVQDSTHSFCVSDGCFFFELQPGLSVPELYQKSGHVVLNPLRLCSWSLLLIAHKETRCLVPPTCSRALPTCSAVIKVYIYFFLHHAHDQVVRSCSRNVRSPSRPDTFEALQFTMVLNTAWQYPKGIFILMKTWVKAGTWLLKQKIIINSL